MKILDYGLRGSSFQFFDKLRYEPKIYVSLTLNQKDRRPNPVHAQAMDRSHKALTWTNLELKI